MGDLVYFLKYLYYLIKYKIFIWLSLIVAAAIFDGLSVGLFLPILEGPDSNSWLSRFIRDVFESVNLEYSLGTILIVMMIFYLIRTAALTFQEIYVKRIETHLLVFLKSDLIDKLFSAKYLYFIRKEIGYFTNAVLLEYGRVAGAFEQCMGVMVSLGFAVVYLALPLAVNPVVTGVVVLLAVPGYFIMLKINSIVRSYSIQSTANHARLQSYLVQAFQSFKYLKATHSDDGILRKIYSATRLQGRLLYKQAVVLIAVEKSTDLVLLLSVSGLMFYYVEIRDAPLIEVLFLLFLMRRAMAYLLRTQLAYRKLVGVSGSIEVFKNLERELQENYEHSERGGSTPDFDQPIRFEQVFFDYGNGNHVFDNINITLPPKQTVAFVGASGAGKSTLVTLLTGLLKPTAGEIFLGSARYEDIDQRLLRKSIGYVTQESVIFHDTIRDNITLWSDRGDEVRVRSAAAGAYINQFIEDLPKGYDTVLGDSGLNISGGQRQRINIARELYKNVRILIFDEATSSLDSESEREIQVNIDAFRGEKTVVVIAHRLSTIRNSDLIFVLKDGGIVEQGAYDELYSRGGEFRAMVDQQTLWDVTEAKTTAT